MLANDKLGGAPATTSNVILSFVSSTAAGITLDVADGSVDVAAGTAGGSHSLARITDDDRALDHPLAILQSPLNGATVAGTINVSGQATDSNGQVMEGRFYLNDNRIYTDTRVATTYRMSWNTRSVANGWYTLEFRATDNGDNDGRMLIRVLVKS